MSTPKFIDARAICNNDLFVALMAARDAADAASAASVTVRAPAPVLAARSSILNTIASAIGQFFAINAPVRAI